MYLLLQGFVFDIYIWLNKVTNPRCLGFVVNPKNQDCYKSMFLGVVLTIRHIFGYVTWSGTYRQVYLQECFLELYSLPGISSGMLPGSVLAGRWIFGNVTWVSTYRQTYLRECYLEQYLPTGISSGMLLRAELTDRSIFGNVAYKCLIAAERHGDAGVYKKIWHKLFDV